MIKIYNNIFLLSTKDTSYVFKVLPTGQLEHLHYGEKVCIENEDDANCLIEKHAFNPVDTCIYDEMHKKYSLEDMRLEVSTYGKGDICEPFIEVCHSDGSTTCDFKYDSYKINNVKTKIDTLPSSYVANNDFNFEELVVTLKNPYYNEMLKLYYCVFEDKNIITKWTKYINSSDEPITLNRLVSSQLDFLTSDWYMTTFNGAWSREMDKTTTKISAGKHINQSLVGTSSNRANPFVMLSKEHTTENFGPVYGMNLVYSGNHLECAEISGLDKTHFVHGINPAIFSYIIEPGQTFESPESIITFSSDGFTGMSHNMHKFIQDNIVRGYWQYKNRPILINSWEANYFDISENKLLELAKAAKKTGIELLVMDDGWFGTRDIDTRSLGDWYVNKNKLPNGLSGLCDKVNALGLDFGIWIEPEMINVDSDLYKQHSNWVIDLPNSPHSECRNQRILDLCNPECVEYIIEIISNILKSANIKYVKWDMNRGFSDYYSKYLNKSRQGEVAHRYTIGYYKIAKALTEKFPKILFEGCASGGNRFDLGTLCYFPQIWASDNSDALCRARMQTNYSYGYPMSTITSHVSACPNHQTLRTTPLNTRFNIASLGLLGYEFNMAKMNDYQLNFIKKQVDTYKKYRSLLQFGNIYRGRQNNIFEWTIVSNDKTQAIGVIFQQLSCPNKHTEQFIPVGLDKHIKYHFTNEQLLINVEEFGSLLSKLDLNDTKYLQCESEDYIAFGCTLMQGVKLKQGFAGNGYNNDVRHFPDFASRMYFIECMDS